MKSITIYEANDGTKFYDEYECIIHEFKCEHKDFDLISIYRTDGTQIEDIMSDSAYQYGDVIVVTTDDAIDTLQEINHFCGFDEWETIDSVGRWEYQEKRSEDSDIPYHIFVKVSDLSEEENC